MKKRVCVLLFMALLSAPHVAPADSAVKRTYYTKAKRAALAQNLEKYDWARSERDKILAEADKWLNYDDARLRTLVTPPEVPRAVVAHLSGAPVKGEELNRKGHYSWIIDFDHPWKVKSPIDGALYPSNDFAAFLKSGCKDRSLLTGPHADDGWGCQVDGFDKPFWFVGVYAHWSVRRLLLPAIENLSKAYLITGDPKYAHPCAVLLHQLAEYYPRYWYAKQSRYAKEVKPDYYGRLLYHTWESLYTCHIVPPAYDAIRPAIEKDQALLKLAGCGAEDLRRFIEERLLVTMANDIMDGSGRIMGNYGMHHVSLLRIAAVLRDRVDTPTRADMVQWVVGTNAEATSYAQFGLEDALGNLIYRDGHPFENPGYNTHWSLQISEIVSELGEDAQRFVDMPRFRKLYTWPIRMAIAGKYSPAYGDGGNIWNGIIGWDKRVMVPGYRFYHDPKMAKALVTYYKNASVSRDLFKRSIEEEMEAASRTIVDPVGTRSELMPGVGFGSLQTNNNGNRIGLATLYGDYWGHRHFDSLNLDIFSLFSDGWGYSLLPDLGYPETADAWDPRRFGFLSHTVCHNTVMVNASRQDLGRGRLHLYDRGPFVKVMEVSAENGYPDVATLYRRTLLLIDVAPDNAYVVDIFRVRGGTQHDWLIHGTNATFSSDLAFTEPRKEGTLAGPSVEYGNFYDDTRYADNNKAHVPYTRYKGSGYQWLFNVQQASLEPGQHVLWNRGKAYLKAHLVGGPAPETVFACDGIPQRRKPYPKTLKFVVRRRVGKELESLFVTVFEPYKETPFIKSAKALPVAGSAADMPVALEIDLGDRKHLIFNRLEGAQAPSTAPFTIAKETANARIIVLETAADVVKKSYRLDSTPGSSRAKVVSVDYEKGVVTLDRPLFKETACTGVFAIVESKHHANAVQVAKTLDDHTFSVGDDDLYAGRIHVQSIEGNTVAFLPKQIWFLEAGMSVVNEAGKVVGRIRETVQESGSAELDHEGLQFGNFPDLNADGQRSCKVMIIGPGDTITLHVSSRQSNPVSRK